MSGAYLAGRAALWTIAKLPDGVLRSGSRALFSRSWRRFCEATEQPEQVQVQRLMLMVERAKDTVYGKAHGFSKIESLQAYREQVPIVGYDEVEPYLLRMVAGEERVLIPDRPFFFGRSSGTTGSPKYIPITPMYVAEFRSPRRVWARQVMQAFPGLVRGKILTIHSPRVEGTTEGGTSYGSVTVAMNGPQGVEAAATTRSLLDAAPRSVYLIEDFELKYYAILRMAAQERISLAAAINPSTLALFGQKLDVHTDLLIEDLRAGKLTGMERLPEPIQLEIRRELRAAPEAAARLAASKEKHGRALPTDLWPELVGLLCWKGGSAPFYLAQLRKLFPQRPIMDYGYIATEGGFSIPLSPEGADGVVAVTGHVLEFVPEGESLDPTRTLLAHELEQGARYRVIVSGSHGLYRYDINDIVECTGYFGKTAKIAFVHKGGNMLSITGEKVGERHVVEAGARAAQALGCTLRGLTVCYELVDPPRYVFGVELEQVPEPALAQRCLAALERALGEVNMEYAAKRSSLRLGAPQIAIMKPGAFESERERRVSEGAPDSHVKPPHLNKDQSLLQRLGVVARYEMEDAG